MARPYGTSDFSPDEMLKEAIEYFKYCEATKVTNGFGKEISKPKTISGFAKWLGKGKNYINEKAKDDNYKGMILYIRNEIENDIEEKAMVGLYNPAIAAKNLSANFDWKDKQEVDQNIKGELNISNVVIE